MGEKRRFFNEEELARYLSQFPTIEDKRSKAELYEQIQIKMNGRQKRKKVDAKRWIPLVTAAVVLIFIIVLSPSFFHQEQTVQEQAQEAFDISLFSDDENRMNGLAESTPDGMQTETFTNERKVTGAKRETGGYFLSRMPDGSPVLVSGELSYFNHIFFAEDKHLESVLHEMEFPQEVGAVESPFPAGVSIEQLHIESDEVFITLNGGEKLADNVESELFIEAILLTADQFEIDFVTFIGTSGQQIGPYLLTERLQTKIVSNWIR